ncbi:hypothetical protein F4827_000797 [Paraburkholderia bannensis]|uniref:Multidrug ABC transporter ATPase n=1 Tax=Paraburkholderia bannensis TaxID=765414 RepID=A0A7W9TUM6_9BURK|nr:MULTISPECIES: hypothetical protein [Paraburkholderia]MBB3255971.1 hypothetical protein [Paraburkholderia sp. WP4_3_2]MBB6100971.1 hypothetical protein [Paraburkholderia bannensis]
MLYLKNALGGIGRSVTCTARHAFAHAGGAARWRKIGLYAAMFVLPGGSIAVVLMLWADRRRSQRGAQGANVTLEALPATAVNSTLNPAAAAKTACTGVAHSARGRAHDALHALRRWRGNNA